MALFCIIGTCAVPTILAVAFFVDNIRVNRVLAHGGPARG